MTYALCSWQYFIRQRLDGDSSSRRLVNAFSQSERSTSFPIEYVGQMGCGAVYSARELCLRGLFLYEFGQGEPAIWLGGEHKDVLPLAKVVCQASLCQWEIEMGSKRLYPWGMPIKPRKGRVVRPATGRLYIGEWIKALGDAPTAVATCLKLNPGYLSQLINNKKKNPSYWVLCEVADHLKIPVDYLRKPPPAITAGDIDQATLARLLKPKQTN